MSRIELKPARLREPDDRLAKAAVIFLLFPLLACTVSFFLVAVPFLLLTGNETSRLDAMSPVLFWGILMAGGLTGSVIAFRTCRKQWPRKPPTLTVDSPGPGPMR